MNCPHGYEYPYEDGKTPPNCPYCDNAALRTRVVELDTRLQQVGERARHYKERATRAEARVGKLERVREAAALLRECTGDPLKLCNMLDEALAECAND